MKGFETLTTFWYIALLPRSKKECPAMKGFETRSLTYSLQPLESSKKECPAMKGFETDSRVCGSRTMIRKKECPAMKGFETLGLLLCRLVWPRVRRNAPL